MIPLTSLAKLDPFEPEEEDAQPLLRSPDEDTVYAHRYFFPSGDRYQRNESSQSSSPLSGSNKRCAIISLAAVLLSIVVYSIIAFLELRKVTNSSFTFSGFTLEKGALCINPVEANLTAFVYK